MATQTQTVLADASRAAGVDEAVGLSIAAEVEKSGYEITKAPPPVETAATANIAATEAPPAPAAATPTSSAQVAAAGATKA